MSTEEAEATYRDRTEWSFTLDRIREAIFTFSVFWPEIMVALLLLGARGLKVLLDPGASQMDYAQGMTGPEWVWGLTQLSVGLYWAITTCFGPRVHRAIAAAVGLVVCVSTADALGSGPFGWLSPAPLLWLTVGAIPAAAIIVRHFAVLADPIEGLDYPE